MKADNKLDNIYFSRGFFVEHTVGYFNKIQNELVITDPRFLGKILKYLAKFLGEKDFYSITLTWYR